MMAHGLAIEALDAVPKSAVEERHANHQRGVANNQSDDGCLRQRQEAGAYGEYADEQLSGTYRT